MCLTPALACLLMQADAFLIQLAPSRNPLRRLVIIASQARAAALAGNGCGA